ncbi:hypothetical protein [Actinomadura sp. NPDC048394]
MPATPDPAAFPAAVAAVRAGASPDQAAGDLLGLLTPEERLWLLDGDQPF